MLFFFEKIKLLVLVTFIFLSGCSKSEKPQQWQRRSVNHSPAGISDFSLLDQKGVMHSLYREGDAKAVVIISQGNSCPIVRRYAETIRSFAEKWEKKGVTVWLLNSNFTDDRASIIAEDREFRFGAPILMDPAQSVSKSLGFTRTGEAVILQPGSWEILYRGAIDDRLGYGVDKQIARDSYLENALQQVMNGEAVSVISPPTRGCKISYRAFKNLSFAADIAPIIKDKCIRCHSESAGYKPYFTSSESIAGWAKMIKETILTKRMPPPMVDPAFGKFKELIALEPEEEARLMEWLDSPTEKNKVELNTNEKKLPLINRNVPPKLWSVAMANPRKIGPRGTLEYEYVQLGGPAPFDMWVTKIHTRSSNPAQIHHESMMVVKNPIEYYEKQADAQRDKESDVEKRDGDIPLYILDAMVDDFRNGADPYFVRKGVFASGRVQPNVLPPRTAIFIPKGHYVILEVHYLGNGREDSEQTSIDFHGFKKQPAGFRRIKSTSLYETSYVIPPRRKRYVVTFRPKSFPRDIHIQYLLSHMHVRGRALRMELLKPEKAPEVLISIPDFDFSWHTGAEFVPEKPIFVPKDAGLRVVCEFDNSPENPANPDPDKEIKFGQTFDRNEMCKMNFGYTDAE